MKHRLTQNNYLNSQTKIHGGLTAFGLAAEVPFTGFPKKTGIRIRYSYQFTDYYSRGVEALCGVNRETKIMRAADFDGNRTAFDGANGY